MPSVAAILATFILLAGGLHVTSLLVVAWRGRRGAGRGQPGQPVSILRPVCGLENHIEATLGSSFCLDHPDYEIVFCVASERDPVIPLVERLMAQHPHIPSRLLVGDDRISINPKLNNLVKGWAAARHDWIVMADSNVLMPPDYLQRLFARWIPGTGLVCSPPVGIAPENFWAEIECGFLNTFQARWQLAAEAVGFGFAQGKTMLWRRDILDGAGGIRALAAEAAEDAAGTKIVSDLGLKVRLAPCPFPQPLGRRSLLEVWRRQLRWARLRKVCFKAFFLPELFAGGFFPLLAAAYLVWSGALPLAAALLLAVIWYLAEALVARAMGWPLSWRAPLAWMIRDALLPVLWLAAMVGNQFVWRGNAMDLRRAAAPQPELQLAGD